MKKLIVGALAVVLSTSPAFAGDLRESIAKAAETAAANSPATPQNTEMHSKAMFWAGLAAMAGGGTLAALSASALKKEDCAAVWDYYGNFIGGCVEETNKALLWTGIGAAGGGATLMALGARKHSLSISPSQVAYRFKF